jgi:AcrR family transcriptional regulator
METLRQSRRERLRAATVEEIIRAARHLLVREGPAAVTLRAIARDMGVTAPALYRYFPNLDELVASLHAEIYDEISNELEAARDRVPADDPAGRLDALFRAFRDWSVTHPAEFGLIFGSPMPDPDDVPRHHPKHRAAQRFAGVFGELFAQVWRRAPFPVPADDQIAPELRGQFATYLAVLGTDLPLGAVQVFLSCWMRLYGMVAMEVFGHLRFVLRDAAPMFDAEVRDTIVRLGLPAS